MSDFGRLYERRKLRIYLSKGKVMRHSKNCNVSGITISLRKLKVNEVALNRVQRCIITFGMRAKRVSYVCSIVLTKLNGTET